MSKNLLTKIQGLQFKDLAGAEKLLLDFLRDDGFSDLTEIQIKPKPQSLNSINGFANFENGESLFFKTHTEEDEAIKEYYNTKLLEESGYPVIDTKALRKSTGTQIVFYPIITLPTLFDEVQREEEQLRKENSKSGKFQRMVDAQNELDRRSLEIYQKSEQTLSAEENRKQPIHQLFSHRLAVGARVDAFYKNSEIELFGNQTKSEDLFSKNWTINGTEYKFSLSELVSSSRSNLEPAALSRAVTGHGDAHNGNVFIDYDKTELLYFDPAFAGTHSPVLDITKPIFHNIFAKWMYFPECVEEESEFEVKITESDVILNHNFSPSLLRKQFLNSKMVNIIEPYFESAQAEKRDGIRKMLGSALSCCPLLTVNLFSSHDDRSRLESRYSDNIRILGLSMAVQCFDSGNTDTQCSVGSLLLELFDRFNGRTF